MTKDYQTAISGSGSKRSAEPVRRLTPDELGIPENSEAKSEGTSWEKLYEEAMSAVEQSEVEAARGCAVLDSEGIVWTAATVKTTSESVHSTRVAVLCAASNGDLPITKMVLDTDGDQQLCGSCRELLYELSEGEADVRIVDDRNQSQQYSISDLLPK